MGHLTCQKAQLRQQPPARGLRERLGTFQFLRIRGMNRTPGREHREQVLREAPRHSLEKEEAQHGV